MLPLIVAYAQITPVPLREDPSVGYSGIPSISGPNLTIVSHTVNLAISKDHVDVSSVTLVKNNGPAGTWSVTIPSNALGKAPLPSGFAATWANMPVEFTTGSVNVLVQNRGSYALRVRYSVPLGQAGLDHSKRLVAYSLLSELPVGTLMVTYTYEPGVVFHLPEVGPAPGWEVGRKGAFWKRINYTGRVNLTYCAFYPGGY